MGKLKTYIGEDIGVNVEYDYQPYNHMTKTDAAAVICAVRIIGEGPLDGEDVLELMKDEVIDQLEMRCMVNEVGE